MVFLGTDPEFAVVEKKTGKPVPAHRFFGGKTEKTKYPSGYAFYDGFMLEVNSMTAPGCRQQLIGEVHRTLAAVNEKLAQRGEYEVRAISSIPVDVVDFAKDAPGAALEFGCDPSRDAYQNGAETRPDGLDWQHKRRYAGGHMHFSAATGMGYTNNWLTNKDYHPAIAKVLDYWIGLPLTIAIPGEAQFERREYYGKAGEFRSGVYPSSYPDLKIMGIEYRTPPSELWMHPLLPHLFYGVAKFELFSDQALLQAKINEYEMLGAERHKGIQEAINTGKNAVELCPVLKGYYDADTLLGIRQQLKKLKQQELTGWAGYANYIPFMTEQWKVKVPYSNWYMGMGREIKRAA